MKLHLRSGLAISCVCLALSGCDWLGDDKPAAPLMAVQVVEAKVTDVPLTFEMVGSTLGNQDVPIRARVEGLALSCACLILSGCDWRSGLVIAQPVTPGQNQACTT